MIKTCIVCGREFESYHGLQTCCSVECKHKRGADYDRKYYREKKTARPIPTRSCIVCGRDFQPPTSHRNRRTCSAECRHQRKLKYDAEYIQRDSTPYTDRAACNRRLLDYLAGLESAYGKLPNGRIKRLILDWSNENETDNPT